MRLLLVEACGIVGFLSGFMLLLFGANTAQPLLALGGTIIMVGSVVGLETVEEMMS